MEFSPVWKASREDREKFIKSYPEAGANLLMKLLAERSAGIRATNLRLAAAELDAAARSMWHL